MVRMQWVVRLACGLGHPFSLSSDGPIAQAYGYVCPETGRPAATDFQRYRMASEHPELGAVTLLPIMAVAQVPAF
jgi:hypothetical protein